MKFGKNPGLNFSTEGTDANPADDEGNPEETEDTAASRGYHMLTELPPEDQRNLSFLHEKLPLKDSQLPKEPKQTPEEPKRLDHVTSNREDRKNKNNKDLIAVFSAMSVIGALGSLGFSLGFRLLAS